MKKLLILLLAISVIVGLAACGGDSEESSATSSTSSTTTSSNSTSSKETSSAASSVESSEETSEPEEEPLDWEVAETISQFVSWNGTVGTGLTTIAASDATSLQLTAINESPVDGVASVIAFNYDYGRTIESDDGSYDDYNILVFTYDESTYGYSLTESLGVEDEGKDDVEIPDDGYVLAVHKHWQAKVDAMLAAEEGTVFFPHGFRATDALDASIKSGTATIDGKVTESEYGKPIWEIDPDSIYANYEQFDLLEVEVTAKVYMMYDSEYLYIGVVVDSPNHYLPKAESLWRYDSIQVNILSLDPYGEYFTDSNYWNWGSSAAGMSTQASVDNVFRQYGFGVTDDGESCHEMYAGANTEFTGERKCVRDDGAQTTTYEVAIPLSECGGEDTAIVGKAGTVIGVSVSVNQGDEEAWKNVMLRDGGGVIGVNDLTKVPTIKFN